MAFPSYQHQPPLSDRVLIHRELAVNIARSYLGTPYRLGAYVKRQGVDCGSLIACYLVEIGAARKEDFADVGIYSHDWFCNTRSERYLLHLMRHAQKTMDGICRGTVDAKPGSIVLFRVARSKVFNHGGIVTGWPKMIHAADPCVKETNAVQNWMTSHREIAVFDPWGIDATR